MSSKELSDRVALITGGSRGIGRAVAVELARRGAKVAVNYVSQEKAAMDVVEQIQSGGGEALVLQGDVSSSKAVDAMVETVMGKWEHIDVLVNNAGIARDTLLMRMSEDDWDAVLGANLKGAFLCTRAVMRSMLRRRWGRVINISSIVGVRGNAGQANYAAAKAGLIGFTKSVAKEVASRNITVNALAPGWIESDMVAAVPENLKQEAFNRIPMGRFGVPQDVAGVVAFLASDAAAYITGQVIGVDGAMAL